MKRSLHWSFDYFDESRRPPRVSGLHPLGEPLFHELLKTYLESAYPNVVPENSECSLRYVVVSNWAPGRPLESPWNDGGGPDIRAGEATIRRKPAADGKLQFSATYENHTSGERGEADFTCRNDPFRTLAGGWSLAVENTAGGECRGYEMWGRAVKNGEESLLLDISYDRKVYIPLGQVPASVPCTTNWALLEAFPALAAAGQPRNKVNFAILDDLEKLKPHNTLGYLEKFSQVINGSSVELEGYHVHGTGTIPAYYWLDDQGHVAIMTNLYLTYVLQDIAIE